MKYSNLLVTAGLATVGLGAINTTEVEAQTARPSMARAITLTGIVGGAPMAREFFLRANGETYRVQPLAKVGMSGVRGGDRVRVFGRPTGLIISHANVRVLTSRASDNASDYITPDQRTTIQTQPSRRTGGPARSTTNQSTATQGSNQGTAMQNNVNRRPINRPVQGIVTPGIVAPGFVGPGVVTSGVINPGIVTPGVVTPNVVVPGAATSNAIRQTIIKQGQAN